MQDFSNLPKTIAAALTAKGYSEPTPVQTAVAQADLAELDLLVSAQTGSGKTVGFGLALMGDLLDESGRFGRAAAPLAVVIAPTRELALQVRQEFDWLFSEAGIVTASAVGGMDARTERRAFERGAHVVVATPGRLRDHVSRGVVDLSDLRAVVLDEADEMLDMGFSEDLEYILDHTPETRRTLLFSATVSNGIAKLARTYQKENVRRIEVGNRETQHADIEYLALNVAPSDTEKAIINLLRYHDAQTAIIFANTRSMVARLTAKFANRGFSVVSLSGELSQSERSHALQSLRDGRARVCIATDVAARGIDLPGLELVIHADLPSNAEGLLHRSGRTGRAGRKGKSVLIVPGRQRSKAQRLLKSAKLQAEWAVPPSAEAVLARDEERILLDPAWDEPVSAEEQAFSKKLLNNRSAEQIVAAYLRLYRERHSPPEVLSGTTEPGERKKRDTSDFGPSTWFSLSLGRKDRAEPRWLLPMLCRNAGLSKTSIGAIRVQYQETFVEILTSAVPAMKAELGPDLALEQGASLSELSGVPDFTASPKGPPPAPRDTGERVDLDKKPRSRNKHEKAKHSGTSKVAKTGKAKTGKEGSKKHEDRSHADTEHSNKTDYSHPKTGGKKSHSKKVVPPAKRSRKYKNPTDRPDSNGPQKEQRKTNQGKPPFAQVKTRAGKGPDARPMRKPKQKGR